MSYSKEVVRRVTDEYDAKSKNAIIAAERKKRELYSSIDGLADIDAMLAGTCKQVFEAVLAGNEGITARIEQIKTKNLALQEKRRVLLGNYGYAPDYTDPVYECPLCDDTGYGREGICPCFKRAAAAASIDFSGIGEAIRTQSFENFSLEYYSKEKNASGVTPYEVMRRILKECTALAESFSSKDAVTPDLYLFIGTTGLGKTHLSSAVAGEAIKAGYEVVYDSAQNIIYGFERERFSRNQNNDEQSRTEKYGGCDLLIIDDLGTEYSGSMAESTLYNLINMRLMSKKKTIISTNLTIEGIQTKYNDRISSRLLGDALLLRFQGEDVRMLKLN